MATPIKRRVPFWLGLIGLIIGAIGSALVGFIPLIVAAVMLVGERGPAFDVQAELPGLVTNLWVLMPSILLTGATMAFVAVATVFASGARPIRKVLGFRGAHWLTFVVAPIGILGLGPLSDLLRRAMHYFIVHYAPFLETEALEGLDQLARSAPLWVILPAMALAPGFYEELLFRGMFQRSIKIRPLAVFLSGLLFAMIHLDPQHVFAIVPLGLYLAWLADRTDSVVVPMFAHMCNNAAAVIGARTLDASALDEPLEWWWVPIGLAVSGACIAAVVWATRGVERWPESEEEPIDVPALQEALQ